MSPVEHGGITVDPLVPADLGAIAALHLRAFTGSELGHLGPEAVRRYYAWLVSGAHDVAALVARHDDEIVGFTIGGVFHGSTVGFVQIHRWFLLGRSLRHPSIIIRGSGRRALKMAGMLQVRRSLGTEPEQPWRVPEGSFGVLVVAVDPASQRLGVGSALIAAAEQVAVERGFTATHLTVDPGNRDAAAFYASRGWLPLGVPGDTAHQRLVGKQLGSTPPTDPPDAPGSDR